MGSHIRRWYSRKKGEKMNRYRFAIVISSTWNYVPYLNALLNSIEKREMADHCNLDVHVLHMGFPGQYINDICERFSFNVIPSEMRREDYCMGG